MAKPHKFYDLIPDELPFSIAAEELHTRITLATTMLEGVDRCMPDMPIDTMLDTTSKGIRHFEVISGALKSGFIHDYHDVFHINGYPVRICHSKDTPTQSVEDAVG